MDSKAPKNICVVRILYVKLVSGFESEMVNY